MSEASTSAVSELLPKISSKPAKKPAKAKAPLTNGKPKSPVCKPQMRILVALSKAKGPLNRQMISSRAKIAETHVIGYTLKRYKTKKTDALVEQKLARAIEIEVDGRKETCFEITAAGKKLVASAS